MTARMPRPDARAAARLALRFGMAPEVAVRRITSGHINESFEVRGGGPGGTGGGEAGRARDDVLLLQWINPVVFPEAPAVQGNVERVLAHLRESAPELGVPGLRPAVDGALHVMDGSGLWRALEWLPDRRTLARPDDPARAHAAGQALGSFLLALADLPVAVVDPVLADFHDLDRRLGDLDAARALAPADRLRAAGKLLLRIDADRSRRRRGRDAGPERVIHGDPKFTNVLFPASGPAVLVDYDTLMPGRWCWDFGDFLRSAAASAAEDDPDRAGIDIDAMEAGASGVLGVLGSRLCAQERECLADAPARMAYMLAVRFLTDHLSGDVYFRTHRPGQNLDRARAQLAVASAFDAERDRLRVLVDAHAGPGR